MSDHAGAGDRRGLAGGYLADALHGTWSVRYTLPFQLTDIISLKLPFTTAALASGNSECEHTFVRWEEQTVDRQTRARLPGYRDVGVRHFDAPEAVDTRFYEVHAKSILNRVPEASQVPFRWTVNPYRGCTHACAYCFARPTHEFLGLGAGRDFEREIVVKVNAPERLRVELARRAGGESTLRSARTPIRINGSRSATS